MQFASNAAGSGSDDESAFKLLHPPETASVLKKSKSNKSIAIYTKVSTNRYNSKGISFVIACTV